MKTASNFLFKKSETRTTIYSASETVTASKSEVVSEAKKKKTEKVDISPAGERPNTGKKSEEAKNSSSAATSTFPSPSNASTATFGKKDSPEPDGI